jgi:hypothetical protein
MFHASRGRVLAAALVAAGTVAATFAAPAAPAAAALPGLTYVSAQSQQDSTVFKSITIFCPAGLTVVGGGYQISGPDGAVVLDDFIPSPDGDRLTVSAGEIVGPGEPSDGTTANWFIVGTATCMQRPAGWQVVSQTSRFAPGPSGSITASCPFGKALIGAGESLQQGFGQISTSELRFGDNFVTASAVDDEDGYSGSWSVSAFAVCANPLPGLQIVSSTLPADSNSPKVIRVDCPGGTRVLSAGWSAGGPNAEQTDNMEATVFSTFVPTTVQVVGTEDPDGFSGNWQEAAFAICATA